MGWFRSNRRMGAWAALFALFVQFDLSFAHVHKLVIPQIAAQATQAGSPTSPPPPGDTDNDRCDICAVLAMLSGAEAASAPMLPVPVAFVAADPPSSRVAIIAERTQTAFRSRAPPQA